MRSTVSIFFVACLLILNGCGGGGGGGGGSGSGSGAPSKPDFNVVFVPSSLTADLVETGATTWEVQVTVTGTVDGDVYPVIVDNQGVITTNVYLEQLSSTQYRALFRVSNTLAAGKYNGSIKLRLCSSAACTKEYSGSPWSLPYSVDVKSHNNLTGLTAIPNYQGWISRFGGKNNSGYVPVTLDPAQFSYRWYKRVPKNKLVDGLVAENDKIFFYETNATDVNYSAISVVALGQHDGSTLWKKTYDVGAGNSVLSRGFGLNVADGLVSFVRYVPPTGDAYFTALGADAGQTAVEHKIWERSYGGSGALLDKDNIYVYGIFQYHYGFAQFSRSDGAMNWMIPSPFYDDIISKERWLPTVDDKNIYIYSQITCSSCNAAGLNVLDKKTGERVAFVADPKPSLVDRGEMVPPIITNQGVLALNGRMRSFYNSLDSSISLYDVDSKSVKWSVVDNFVYQPVVANEVIYTVVASFGATNGLKVEARKLASGDLLWSLPLASKNGPFINLSDGMIVTDNILFVTSANQVWAIDINTHKAVWEYPFGGRIALTSSGVLIVVRDPDTFNLVNDTQTIAAITLKN